MVKYTLLHKPTVSGWPSIPRQVKAIIIGVILIIAIFLTLVQASRNGRLKDLYTTKVWTAEILDCEIQYMPGASDSEQGNDGWKEASIKDGTLYSAYLDARPEIVLEDRHHDNSDEKTWAVIRIIAILPLEMNDKPLTCHFKYKNDKISEPHLKNRTASRVKAIKENWDLMYSAFFVLCDLTLPKTMKYDDLYYEQHLPMRVALGSSSHENLNDLQFINIRYPRSGIAQTNNDKNEFLAVCGPVLHHEYSHALHLVEYVEYHLMAGADHFTFYNESVSPEVSQVLSYYAGKNLATILDWRLPPIYKFDLTLRQNGVSAALNDCLYRNSFYKNYKYVLVSDVDEFIVPKKTSGLKELMNFLDPPNPSGVRNSHASFKFRNVYFYLMYDDDKTNRDQEAPYLYMQAKTLRVASPEEPEGNGKYIVRSQDVVELGSHSVLTNRPGASVFRDRFDEHLVGEDVAIIHHYRSCEEESVHCYFKPTIIDRSGHKYIKELARRVGAVCTAIFGGSGCPAQANS